MTITTALILLIVNFISVRIAASGVVKANDYQHRQMYQQGKQINQEIAGLRQEINQQGKQMAQLAQQVGHLAGLLEGLIGRPIATEQPEEIRVR